MDQPTSSKRLEVRERPTHRNPIMYQKWRNLLFLHWEYDRKAIQRTLPEGLQVDTFAGKAYIGIIPFFMKDVRPRFFPTVPGLSDFQELNVRTYVYDHHGTPGIWFYSLDANQWLAVQVARWSFNLPYFYATIQAEIHPDTKEISYSSHRSGSHTSLKSYFKYRPISSRHPAEPETLEFFLIERYVLFAYSNRQKKLFRGRVHHVPYPLVEVEVGQSDKNLFTLNGLSKPEGDWNHSLMSPGVDVEVFSLEAAD